MQKSNLTIIEPGKGNRLSFSELWNYRELFLFFAWRDIKVRYKQTFIGAGWAILQPVLATGVFTLFFNRIAGIKSGAANIPYAVFAYLGLMYWNSFSSTINTVGNSLLSNTGVITKVYFPRLLPPLSAMALSVVDFFFAAVFFFVLMLGFKLPIHLSGVLLLLPALLLIQLAGLGLGIFFAALNVKYRDVRTALPFITQMLLFATPVIYPASLFPGKLQFLLNFNPAASAINIVRGAFFNMPINWRGVGMSILVVVVIMVLSLIYFKKAERNFVDII